MIVVEDPTTITYVWNTNKAVSWWNNYDYLVIVRAGQQIIIIFWFGEIISEAISLFVLFDRW